MSLKSKIQMTLAGMAICVAASAQTSEPIKVGLSGPFTGGSSPMGVAMRDAMRLAVDEINKSGGVLGRQIQLVERDDEAKNERGAQVVQELIHREKVVAGLGIINTGVMLASARFYQEAKIPVITPGPTGTQVTKLFQPPEFNENYVFRVSLPDHIQADMIAEEAVTKRGYKKVAILADSTNYGQLGREDMTSALEKRGVKPVAVEVRLAEGTKCARSWKITPEVGSDPDFPDVTISKIRFLEDKGLDALAAGKGQVDVSFEAAGHYGALANCIHVTRPRGTVVQIGWVVTRDLANMFFIVFMLVLPISRHHDRL